MRTVFLVLALAGVATAQPVTQPNWHPHVICGCHGGTARIGQTTAFVVQVLKSCEVAAPTISPHMAFSANVLGLRLWSRYGDDVYVWANLAIDPLFFRSTLAGNVPPLSGWGVMRVVPRGTSAPMTVTLPYATALIGSGFYVQAFGWEWFPSPPFPHNWSCQFTTLPQYVRVVG